jgi:hypothetical protein
LVVAQNNLEQWDLSIISVDPERKLGTFESLQEVIAIAEDVVRRCRSGRVKLLQKHAPWHDNSASDSSKRYLQKVVGKKRTIAYCTCPVGEKCSGVPGTVCQTCNRQQMTAGQVALAINKYKAKGTK